MKVAHVLALDGLLARSKSELARLSVDELNEGESSGPARHTVEFDLGLGDLSVLREMGLEVLVGDIVRDSPDKDLSEDIYL